jgi:Predicted permease
MTRIFYALAVLAWASILFPYPGTLFIAGGFACFSYPAYRLLHARWPDLRAVFAYAAGVVILIAIPVTLLIVLVVPQAKAGYNMLLRLKAANFQMPQHWLDRVDSLTDTFSFIPGFEEWMQELGTNLEHSLGEGVRALVSGGVGVLGGTVTVLWTVFLFVTFSTMAVAYAPRLRSITLMLTGLPDDMLTRFTKVIRAALRGVFMGILLVAVAQGILCGIGFSVAGVAQPAFWGLLATIVAPIPIVGTAIIWVPLCIVLWFSGSMGAAIGLAIWGMVAVAGIDNILRPLFLKQGINAPLFALVLAILCGLSTFGPVGLVLGPVLVAFAVQAVREADCLTMHCTPEAAPLPITDSRPPDGIADTPGAADETAQDDARKPDTQV